MFLRNLLQLSLQFLFSHTDILNLAPKSFLGAETALPQISELGFSALEESLCFGRDVLLDDVDIFEDLDVFLQSLDYLLILF